MNTEPGSNHREFELRGIDHLALVCSDMQRTLTFYGDVLGMPLVEDIELPDRTGHHFIFDIGKGALLAFFWFDNQPQLAPVAARPPGHVRGKARRHDLHAAHSLLCHIAFDVPAEKIDDYFERLKARGVPATIVNYNHSREDFSETVTENTIGRSIYFTDPDGVMLEFATQFPAAGGRVQTVSAGSEAQRSSRKHLLASTCF